MLFDLFVVQYVTLTLFCLSVMVSTVPADYEPCEPHGLSSGNQNPYIEEEQTTQWPNEKVYTKEQTMIYKAYI
jgi:hypothetical protein